MCDKMNRLFQVYPYLEKIDQKLNGRLYQSVTFKKMLAGEIIKTDNMECSNVILVLKGKIKIEKLDKEGKEVWLYELGPGEICHDSITCYMKCEPLNLTAYALTEIEIAIIPIKEMNQYIIHDIDFLTFMYMNLYDKFRKVILDKEESMNELIYDRIIKYLQSKNTSIIYVTHQQIALELGSAREVISRNLKVMEKRGLIEMKRNKIRLLNL